MKKVVLTLVALVAMAGLVFAAAPEFKPTPSLAGSASLTFGFDLDTGAFGIANSSSGTLKLSLIPAGSDEKGGEGDVYGWIKLVDYSKDTPTTLILVNPSVEARLYLGPVYINILGESDEVNYAGAGASVAKGFNLLTSSTLDVKNEIASEYQGFTLGLKDTSVVDVKLGVASNYDWTGAAASLNSQQDNSDSGWIFYAKVGLNLAPLSLNLGFNAGTDAYDAANATTAADADGDGLGFGAKASLNIDLGGGLALKPGVAFDFASIGTGAAGTVAYSEWELAGAVRLAFPGSKLEQFGDIEPGVHVGLSMGSDHGATFPAYSALTGDASIDTLDFNFAFADGDIIPVLNLGVVFELTDLGNDTTQAAAGTLTDANDGDMGLGIYAGVTIDGGISAYGKFTLKDINTGDSTVSTSVNNTAAAASQPDSMNLEVGVTLDKIIANTTFTLKYTSGNLSFAYVYPETSAATLWPAATKLGAITFETKISY